MVGVKAGFVLSAPRLVVPQTWCRSLKFVPIASQPLLLKSLSRKARVKAFSQGDTGCTRNRQSLPRFHTRKTWWRLRFGGSWPDMRYNRHSLSEGTKLFEIAPGQPPPRAGQL